jgi:protein-S-isoprenylcysteine O-methyltransferase Ste14
MKTETKEKIAHWGKIVIGIIGFIIWIDVIISISQSPAPFIEQAPYCMISTMVISGILTGIFKGLDYWVSGESVTEE